MEDVRTILNPEGGDIDDAKYIAENELAYHLSDLVSDIHSVLYAYACSLMRYENDDETWREDFINDNMPTGLLNAFESLEKFVRKHEPYCETREAGRREGIKKERERREVEQARADALEKMELFKAFEAHAKASFEAGYAMARDSKDVHNEGC